jgi:ligand-binding sensor domain-containing protein/signal transduction histidine kinase
MRNGARGHAASLPSHGGSLGRGKSARAVSLSGLIVLGLVAPALALDPRRGIGEYVHDAWDRQEGLPQSSVMAVLQSRDGYLWLGTHGGLARFDGVGFTLLLKDQHVQALLEDRDGAVWVGTWGNGLVRYGGGRLVSFTTREGLVQDEVRSLLQTRDGALWIGTNGGLSRLQDGVFSSHTAWEGLVRPVVRALYEDEAGTLWIGTHGGGLSSFRDGRFVRHVKAPDLRADEVIRALHPAADGGLWLATERGLKRLEGSRVSIYTRPQGLADDDVMALRTDRDGALWIGTRRGLSRLHQGRLSRPASRGVLADAEVRSLFEDREGSLWVGTYNSGLSRLKDRAFQSLTAAHGLSDDNIRAVFEDRSGALWIGTHNGGVNRVQDGRVTVFNRAHGLPSDRVWSVAEDAAGTVWLGTFGGGVARYAGGRFETFSVKDGLPSDVVRSVLASRDGSVWVGTMGGLGRLRGRQIERFERRHGLEHLEILTLHEAADGTLWIGTPGGLHRLRGDVIDVPPGGRAPGIVLALLEDADGTLWLGTRGRGLWRLKDGRWRDYSTSSGLLDDTVLHILADDAEHLWLSSPRGIFRVARRDLSDDGPHPRSGVSYDRADGMDSVECNGGFQPAGWRTRDGRLWFPTMKGVAVIDPRRSPINMVPPPVRIEAVRVGGRPAALDPAPRLTPGNKSLEISYVGLSFVAPEKVRFRYKLEGFDEDWVEAGTRRTAYYTTLPPGSFRFRVMACNNSGYWSEQDAALELSVLPWFYQTWWFYTGAFAVAGLLAASHHGLRMRRARKRFAAVLDERTRIARELHDTLAQGLAVVGLQLEALAARWPRSEEDEAAQHHLEQARRQVRVSLVEARHSVWDLRSPRLEDWDLRGALESLAEEVRATGTMETGFRFEGIPRALPDNVKRHLLRIAQEAVSNTLKHAHARRVEITLSMEARALRLVVSDDGCGFDPETVASGAHFGLAGMRERARLIAAQLEVARAPSGGTAVTVCLPLEEAGKEHRPWRLFRGPRRPRSSGWSSPTTTR